MKECLLDEVPLLNTRFSDMPFHQSSGRLGDLGRNLRFLWHGQLSMENLLFCRLPSSPEHSGDDWEIRHPNRLGSGLTRPTRKRLDDRPRLIVPPELMQRLGSNEQRLAKRFPFPHFRLEQARGLGRVARLQRENGQV